MSRRNSGVSSSLSRWYSVVRSQRRLGRPVARGYKHSTRRLRAEKIWGNQSSKLNLQPTYYCPKSGDQIFALGRKKYPSTGLRLRARRSRPMRIALVSDGGGGHRAREPIRVESRIWRRNKIRTRDTSIRDTTRRPRIRDGVFRPVKNVSRRDSCHAGAGRTHV